MVRSIRLAEAGAALFCISVVTLIIALPRFSPYEFFMCTPIQGGTQCSSSLNPDYLIVFLLSVAGTITFFFGLFGRRFVLKPLFIIGMTLLEWSLLGMTFGYLALESCAAASPPVPCVAYNPGFYLPAAIGGAALIVVQSAIQMRSSSVAGPSIG